MAFTGDLENLHIVDIIQLIHTTRKSGTFSVTGSKGESRIIFSNGYIVGANHLNNKVRIGTVLVKMKSIALEDLRLALEAQKKAGKTRKPLISTTTICPAVETMPPGPIAPTEQSSAPHPYINSILRRKCRVERS